LNGNEPTGLNSTQFDALDVARFWKYVDVQHDAKCWPWIGGLKAEGYGEFVMPDRKMPAHRAAYEIVVGPIPEGLVVRHKCDNRACCNPKHLETGTHADNVRDRVIRGRSAIGEDAGRAILTEADVHRIRTTPRSEWRVLAFRLRVAYETVIAAGIGRSWKHLPMPGAAAPPAPPAAERPIVVQPVIMEATQPGELDRIGLVAIPEAAAMLGIDVKRMRGHVFRGMQGKLDAPIGCLTQDMVYGWSCAELMKRASLRGNAAQVTP
jgi:hypothetical protein